MVNPRDLAGITEEEEEDVEEDDDEEDLTIVVDSVRTEGSVQFPRLCGLLPPASNVGALCCTAIRTVLSVLSHTLYNH